MMHDPGQSVGTNVGGFRFVRDLEFKLRQEVVSSLLQRGQFLRGHDMGQRVIVCENIKLLPKSQSRKRSVAHFKEKSSNISEDQ